MQLSPLGKCDLNVNATVKKLLPKENAIVKMRVV